VIGAAFDRLCGLPVVRPAAHGLMLHEDVRRLLAQDLRWRRPERYHALRDQALAYYRERVRAAPAEEREWLLAECLFFLSDPVIQQAFFSPDELGQVAVEPARPEDHDALRRLGAGEGGGGDAGPPGPSGPPGPPPSGRRAAAADAALLDALLRWPGTRLRLARDRDGRVLGFSAAVPLCQESVPLLARHPAHAPLLGARWGPPESAALPATAAEATAFYFARVVEGREAPAAVRAVLLRDLSGLFARGGAYLCTTAAPAFKRLLEACGFAPVPDARNLARGVARPVDGYVLDLSRIGLEAWLDAVAAGRPPPRALDPGALERELQAVLLHWRDDARLAASPLAAPPPAGLAAGAGGAGGPDALREAVLGALAAARARAAPELELAYRAVELAYLERATSHERAAERLNVSRATFYRLLTRGVSGIAAALLPPRPE
jgi:hypothetical protein